MRKLWIILSGVVLLLIIAAVVAYLTIDSLAKAAVEKGGSYALGVDTRVGSASVSLLRGHLGLDNVTVANPSGYRSALLLKSGRWDVDAKTGSLFSDVIDVPRIGVSDIVVNIDRKAGGSNIQDVVNHITALGSGEKKEGGRRVRIGTIEMKNITANVQLLATAGDSSVITVRIPEIVLNDVSDKGVSVADVMARVFPAVIAAVLDKGKGIIPADLAADIGGSLSNAAKTLGEGASKLIGQTGDLGKQIQNAAKPLEDAAKGAAEGVGKTLDGLFGNKKDK